jgi:phosphohistidine phosphatase
MNLYIMRHGMAEPYHARSDESRLLVAEGEAQVRNVASQWQRISPSLDLIIASPYNRAQQTATIVKDVLGFAGELQTNPLITPEGDMLRVAQYLDQFASQDILLVSHMPLVASLLGYLTSGDPRSSGGFVTAQLVHLSGDHAAQGCMDVERVLYPE